MSAFDYDDDLTQVPHGIWAKIQYGGLLGLQAELGKDEDRVSNIAGVIRAIIQQYEPLEEFPFVNLVRAMKVFRIRRKRMG